MRVAVPHSLERAEVRRRLDSQKDEIVSFVPGGMAEVTTAWQNEDRLNLTVHAMGQKLDGHILIEDHQVVFDIDLPLALSFIGPVIEGAIAERATKFLT